MVGLSDRAAGTNPALARWLSGAGLVVQKADGRTRDIPGPFIYDSAEAHLARDGDIVVRFAEGAPSLILPPEGPAAIRFGFDDMAFGHALIAELARPAGHPAGADSSSQAVLEFAARVAHSDAAVLVLGETGTGKEGIARFIHATSPRAEGSYVAVNCAALPETMLEAILFGHRKGSFTGAGSDGEGLFRAAAGGTLLLDEVAEIPLVLQAKLLRALQEREVLPVGAVRPEPVNVRIIACANRDLPAEVAAGRFRADLYWRLNVVPVHLRPLRERRLDIRAIAAALLIRHARAAGLCPFPTRAALTRLMNHDWPGNCRELENVLQRALLLRRGDRIDADDIILDDVSSPCPTAGRTLEQASRSAEMQTIRAALDETGGHRLRAAERLGISERTLRYRLAEMRAAAA